MGEALAFLTCLGRARSPGPRASSWFPAVGLLLGLALGALWWAAHQVWGAGVAAAVVIVADLALTGMLHFDGLVDAADGLLPHLDRGRRLEVMREPQVGAFGVAAAGATLLLRWAALAGNHPRVLLIAGLWCASRSAMAVTLHHEPYARPGGGLASGFAAPGADGTRATWVGLAGLLVGGVLCAGSATGPGRLAGLGGWLAGLIGFAGVVGLARRRLGGFTGDVLGAAGVVAETLGLVVAAARW